MRFCKPVFILAFLFRSQILLSQAISQSASYHDLGGRAYLRFHYENDYFTATDIYYTQGISLEWVHPWLKSNPINHLLLRPAHYQLEYGLALEHDGYTPSSIRHQEILTRDHPYAACLLLKSFIIATGPEKEIRTSTSFSTGVIGHLANGDWMQKSIHKWTHNQEPLGWENQIKNDIILNYDINVEKRLISYKRFVLINLFATIKAGTLSEKAGIGFVSMVGIIDDHFFLPDRIEPFQNKGTRSHLNLFLFCHPVFSLVGYDATLQGGIFNRGSPYVLTSSEIERTVLGCNGGIIVRMGKWGVEYFQSIQTKEFKSGSAHRWGGIRVSHAF